MSTNNARALLVFSGLVDVAWAASVKMSAGYARLGWAAMSIVLLILFIVALGRALQVPPMGSAYAVWTGIGAVALV